MEFQVLGPLAVERDGESLPLGGPKPRLVLAVLLAARGRSVSTSALIDALWSDDPPPTAKKTLQGYVHRLRGQLGGVLSTAGDGYSLHAETLDALEFERLHEEAKALLDVDPRRASELISEALELWTGSAYADVATELALLPTVTRLEETRLDAVADRIDADLALGVHHELVGELKALTHEFPLRERFRAQLMLALYRAGRQGEALRAYEQTRRYLGEELGIEPSAELARLEEQILMGDEDLQGPAADPGAAVRAVRGYELRNEVGRHGERRVYRGYQRSVGREVAVVVIGPELANDPQFIARLQADTERVARLDHSNIVYVQDTWREPDRAYQVMRWIDGEPLESRLAGGAFTLTAGMKIVEQIGSALAHAHRAGVVHGRLGLDAILVTEDNDAYLTHFAVGTDEADLPPSADRTAFAVLAHRILLGEPPVRQGGAYRAAASVASLPRGVDAAFELGFLPDGYDRVDDFLRALRRATATDVTPLAPIESQPFTELRNPYKGLQAFQQSDAGDFFGREELVDRLQAAVAANRLVALVGPSGAGKSSLAKAGLAARLHEDERRWLIAHMYPGAFPFEELAGALQRVAVNQTNIADELVADRRGLVRVLKAVLPDDGSELVLMIDQFEELFSMVDDEATRTLLLDNLQAAIDDPRSRLRIVLTLRADFFDRPLEYAEFGTALEAGLVPVTVPDRDGLARAISQPAERVGLDVEAGLIPEILRDIDDQPGSLPMLQYALTELFRRRSSSQLTLKDYRASGGVLGALGHRAEELYAELGPRAQLAIRQAFLRLVTVDEAADDIRRRVTRYELNTLDIDRGELDEALRLFGTNRLLTFDRDPSTGSPTVEVAHEALIREWDRLRDWVDSEREDLVLRKRLASALAEWRQAGEDDSYLPTGGRLAQLEEWAASTTLSLNAEERSFLQASVEREASTRARSARRRRLVMAGLALLSTAALLFGVVAVAQRNSSREQTRLAVARELSSAALANLDDDPQRSILLALEAAATTGQDGFVTREATEALHAALRESRVVWVADLGSEEISVGARFSPDGTRIAAGSADGAVRLFDAATGDLLDEFTGHTGGVMDVRWLPDERLMSVSPDNDAFAPGVGGDGSVRIWDASTGEQVRVWADFDGFDPLVLDVSADGSRAAVVSPYPGEVKVLNTTTGETELSREVPLPIGVAFDPTDATRLAVSSIENPAGGGGGVYVLDVTSGDELLREPVGVCFVDWSPDGALLATAGADMYDTVDPVSHVLDAATGAEVALFEGHNTHTCSVEFSTDSELVITGGDDAAARVWEARTGREVAALLGHRERVGFVHFSPDGSSVLSTSPDGTLRVWEISQRGRPESFAAPGARTADAIYLDGTDSFLMGAWTGEVEVRSRLDGSVRQRLNGAWEGLAAMAAAPDSSLAAIGDGDGVLEIVDTSTGRVEDRIPGIDSLFGVAMSADGRFVAYTGGEGEDVTPYAHLIDLTTGARVPLHDATSEAVWWVVMSKDGSRIAAALENTIRVWDTATAGTESVTIDTGLGGDWQSIENIAVDDDGTSIIVATQGGPVVIYDAASGDQLQTLVGHAGSVNDAALSPDGLTAVSVGDDGTIRLWDVHTGEEALRLEASGGLASVDFSEDGSRLLVAGDFGVREYEVDTESLIELAQSRLVRWWTPDECSQYLGTEDCPESPTG